MRQAFQNPVTKWSQVPDLYRNDKDFDAEFIRKAHRLPSKADLERSMDQKIRKSKEVMLAFVSRNDFLELYADRQLYMPHNLSKDKDVVLKYAQKIPRAIQQIGRDSEDSEICDDREVVLTAVNRNGFEILYASYRLREDEEIIRAACRTSGEVIQVCSDFNTKLLRDRDFLRTTFRSGGAICMLSVKDRDLLRRAAILAPDVSPDLLDQLYEKMPEMFSDSREIVIAVAQRARFAKSYLQKYPALFQDPEIMCHAVFNNPALYFDAVEPLSLQNPIISAELTSKQAHRVLEKLGTEWLVNHEDICIDAIQITKFLRKSADASPDQLWQNSRQLALQWLKRGGRVLLIFEPRLQNDRELALAVAEHVHRDYMKIGATLRADHEFVKAAVSLNGRIVIHLKNPSMELVVLATCTYPEICAKHPGLMAHVMEKLALYDVFRGEFLRGIRSPTSTLYQLNVGSETSIALKETITKFLDVPTGKLLTIDCWCQSSLHDSMNNGPA